MLHSSRQSNSPAYASLTHVSKHGFWLLLGDAELHLAFADDSSRSAKR